MTILTEAMLDELEEVAKARAGLSGGSWSAPELMTVIRMDSLRVLVSEIRRLWDRERDLLAANNVELEKRREVEDYARRAALQLEYTIGRIFKIMEAKQ